MALPKTTEAAVGVIRLHSVFGDQKMDAKHTINRR